MYKKATVVAVFMALLASMIGVVFDGATAQAATPTGLYVTQNLQTVESGQSVTYTARYSNNPTPNTNPTLRWSAVGGSPSTGTGTTFRTRFTTSSINETRVVSVTDGTSTAMSTVFVNGTSSTSTLQCSPSSTNANSGDRLFFSASGGNGSYVWSASGGSPNEDIGSTFNTRFYNYGSAGVTNTVTVRSGNQIARCTVFVYGQSVFTPTPTPAYNWFSIDHTVNNLTRSGSGTSLTVRNGDRLQFVTTIMTGPGYAEDVHVRDWLPQNLTYVRGSTTLDGARYQDGVATGRTNDSLAISTLSPNTTHIVRFEATVNGAPNVTLTNNVNVHVRGLADQTRTSTLRVTGSIASPTPTPFPTVTPTPFPSNSTLILGMTGQNRTRGQTTAVASVRARANDTLEFNFRIRNSGTGYLTNVQVTDFLPFGLRYTAGTTTLNGYLVADGITITGLNIGSLAAEQTATVKFSVTVDAGSVPTLGEVVIINRAQARADGAATVASQMNVTLGQNVNISTASGIPTGPADSVYLALLAAAVATGGYALYTRTDTFGRRSALLEIRATAGRPLNFLK